MPNFEPSAAELDARQSQFAAMYAELGFDDSHYIAYRDIPTLIELFCKTGQRALDYGCGAGRSTRLLRSLGFEVDGVDINGHILEKAKGADSSGGYHLIKSAELPFRDGLFDLVFSGIVFVEVESLAEMLAILREMKRVKKTEGIIALLVSSPEGYVTDSEHFLGDLPENQNLRSGDRAKVIRRGSEISFFDYYWEDSDYQGVFVKAGLKCVAVHRPVPNSEDMDRLHVKSPVTRWAVYVCVSEETKTVVETAQS